MTWHQHKRLCECGGWWTENPDHPNMADEPCTGPRAPHPCAYEKELAEPGEHVKACNCCEACTRECALNV